MSLKNRIKPKLLRDINPNPDIKIEPIKVT